MEELTGGIGLFSEETFISKLEEEKAEAQTLVSPIIKSKWRDYEVKITDTIDEDEPLLCIDDSSILFKGGITTITGKPKSCKTFLTSALCAAALKGKHLGIESHNTKISIVLFDTEQGRARTQKVLRRIYKMCNINEETPDVRLKAISIREVGAKQRMEVVREAINELKADIVIIDGIRDLLGNFNDIDESNELLGFIMKLCEEYRCGIINIIHQNKADTNARGHLGTELMNKSECVIDLKKDKDGTVSVSPQCCRDKEFETFAFRINDEGLPELCNIPKPKQDDKKEKLKKVIIETIKDKPNINRKELASELAKHMTFSPKTGERRIDEAITDGYLNISLDGTYSITEVESDKE